jgi:hypothetical protein
VIVVGQCIVARSRQNDIFIRDLADAVLLAGGWHEVDEPGFAVMGFAAAGSDGQVKVAARGPVGQVSIGEHRPGERVQWRSTRADDGWQPAVSTDLAWANPEPSSSWLFASGADGSVRVLADAEGVWRSFGGGTSPKAGDPSRIYAACRVTGQVEVFTQTVNDGLVFTWWS